MIFRDASVTLQGPRSSPHKTPANSRISRLPPSEACLVRFGTIGQHESRLSNPTSLTCSESTQEWKKQKNGVHSMNEQTQARKDPRGDSFAVQHSPSDRQVGQASPPSHGYPLPILRTATGETSARVEEVREPISSGFGTPSAMSSKPIEILTEIAFSDLENWSSPQSSLRQKASSESANGISSEQAIEPLAMPATSSSANKAYVAGIESWLDSVHSSIRAVDRPGAHDNAMREVINSQTPLARCTNAKPETEKRGVSRASSNKENLSPGNSSPSPRGPPLTNFPSRSRLSSPTFRFASGPNLQDHLSPPPKRKKPRADRAERANQSTQPQVFAIHNDQVANVLAKLSPDVELRRKGKRPKRERCISYWDDDILPPNSPCLSTDTELGVTEQTLALTKTDPFSALAVNAAFNS